MVLGVQMSIREVVYSVHVITSAKLVTLQFVNTLKPIFQSSFASN